MPASPALLDLRSFLYGTAPKLTWFQETILFDTPELNATVQASLTFLKTTTGFRVKGVLEGVAQAPCQSCIGTTEVTVNETFVEEYVLNTIGKEKDKETQAELLHEDFYEVFNPSQPFDVLDLVRQWVVVSLPGFAPCSYVEKSEDAPEKCSHAHFST